MRATRCVPGLAAAAALLAASAPAWASHAGPLRGQWHLDENPAVAGQKMLDSSGHGLDGDPYETILSVSGRFGQGVEIPDDLEITVGDDALLEPQRVSLLAWVKGSAPGAFQTIIAKGGDDSCTASSYALDSSSAGGIEFYVRGPGSNARFSTQAAAPGAIWDGAWHAVAGTYDGLSVRLYVDGVPVGEPQPGPLAIDYERQFGELTMGDYPTPDCTSLGYGESLDEVRLYDRALSATEIARLQTSAGNDPPVLVPDGPGGGGGAGGTRAPLTANFAIGRSQTVRRGIRLNALGSRTDSALSILKYRWDLTGDGRYEIECGGEAPAVSLPVRRLSQQAKLEVVDSAGRADTVAKPLAISRNQVTRSRPGVYACEQPLGGQQGDTPGCVKTFAFGIVDVNSRGAADQCFQIEARVRDVFIRDGQGAASGGGDQIFRPLRDFMDYKATIEGPVALNGLPVPVPRDVKTEYDSGKETISLGSKPILLPRPGGGTFKVADIPLDLKIEPKKTRDYPGGVFTLVSKKIEGDLKGWGGLPRGGAVELLLINKASIAKVALKLPNVFTLANRRAVEGWAAARASNTDGFKFDGMKLGPVDAFLGPVIVSNLQFQYSRSSEVWSGGADIQLLPAGVTIRAAPPPPDYGFGLRRGAFDHAGGGVRFDVPPRPQLFPGVGLVEIGGAIGINPLRFTGRLAIDAGGIVTIDSSAFMAFASPENPYDFPAEYAPPGLEFLGGRRLDSYAFALGGTAGLTVPKLGSVPLLNSYVFYQYPDYLELAGKFEFAPFGDKFKIKGEVGGFVEVLSQLFNLEGQVEACVDIDIFDACLGVGAVVSSKGIAFCTIVPVPLSPLGPTVPVPAGLGYHWGQGFPPDIMVFSCDREPYRQARPSASQAGARSFTIAPGAPSAKLRIAGRGAPPKVVVTGPKGERYALPYVDAASANPNALGLSISETATLEVFLKSPSPGRWTVTPQDGSAPIAGVSVARGLAEARVRGRVRGRGRTRTLTYSARAARGQRIRFVERGARTLATIGRATGAKGRIRFRPAAGRRGRRSIVALVDRGGVTTQVIRVATYAAPSDARPARPRGLRVRRRGTRLVARWRRVAGASGYAVTVTARAAPPVMRVTRRPRLRLGGLSARSPVTVQVAAMAVGNRPGPAARRRVGRR